MYDVLVRFSAELRRTGIPVSLTEVIDAASALSHVDFDDPQRLKMALATTLIKRGDHLEAFNVAFDVYFGMVPPPENPSADPQAESLDALSDDQLTAILTAAVQVDNRLTMRRLAEVLVSRHARMETGRAVAGRLYMFRVLRVVDIDAVVEAAATAAGGGSASVLGGLDARLQREKIGESADFFRKELEAEIRRRLVADRGDDAVAAVVRQTVPEAVALMNASGAELAQLRQAIAPLARKLAVRLARRRRITGRGELDFRHTFRASLSTGGVPVTLRFKPPSKPKPELVVIADVSGSVAAFSRFSFQLLYAMRSEFRKLRGFAFIDNLIEITDTLNSGSTADQAWQTILRDERLVWLDGRSDYGHALQVFTENYRSAVTTRSTVLILGDARNNYRAAQELELKAIARKAAHVFWLNPETQRDWNTGDSIADQYRRYCERMVECKDLGQLRDFADSLAG